MRFGGRSRDALKASPGAWRVVSGDLSTIAGARTVADEVNQFGRFDAVIHNAGVGHREGRVETEPGGITAYSALKKTREHLGADDHLVI
jgi:NAD(P)-dependent dehydrogenase (short-subunit alcohol dehydrogenase family)